MGRGCKASKPLLRRLKFLNGHIEHPAADKKPLLKKNRGFQNFFFYKTKMKFCKKCHRRVLTTEKFRGQCNFLSECAKFCQCEINVVSNDNGPKLIVQFRMGGGGSNGSGRIAK